jgi:hypothetical protein
VVRLLHDLLDERTQQQCLLGRLQAPAYPAEKRKAELIFGMLQGLAGSRL